MPFLAEYLWQRLVRDAEGAPDSIFLAGWPDPRPADAELLRSMGEARRIVELGHKARGETGLTLRQPLRTMYVRGSSSADAHAAEIADELNVKEVRFGEGPVARIQLKPNLPVLGPRLGVKMRDVKAALDSGEYEELDDGHVRAAGEELGPDDVIRGERLSVDGFVMADDGAVSVALSTGARRRAQAREARPRPDPRDQRPPQARGPRDHRPHRRDARRVGRRPGPGPRRVDQAGDTGRGAPGRRSGPADREGLTSAAKRDRGRAEACPSQPRELFLLDPEVVFLNHGSFGACPRPVFDEYQRRQRELERQPVEFLARRYAGLVDEARERLAAYLGAGTDDVVFVPNATAGMNVVARSLQLDPRDEVLLTNHLKTRLYDRHRVEVPVQRWHDRPLLRASFQGYNDERDLDALCEALRAEVG